MNITLTGATGFIGTLLVERLKRSGHQLTIVTRKPREGTNPRFVSWDSKDAFEGCDSVIHLAGEPVAQRWTAAVKERIRTSRVESTRKLVQALATAKQKPSVLISASAIGIYGSRGEESLTESSSPGTGFLPDITRDWEQEAHAAEGLGIRVAMIRIGIVLGHGGALETMLPPFKAGVGGKLGSGQQWMSWIHVNDLIEMIVFALENPAIHGPLNGTAPTPVRNTEFTRALAATLHRPALFSVPEFALRLIYGEMASVIMSSQKVLPEAALNAGFPFRYRDVAVALQSILSPA